MPDYAQNFYRSDRVDIESVNFNTLYQMSVVGSLCVPKTLNRAQAHPAIVVGHPMGAVKEQSATLYAMKLAERGFVTLAIDLPCWGGK